MTRAAEPFERRDLVTMLALLALASVVRFYGLGSPGLSQNEDYVMLCARAILESGVPVLPSGVIYPRALPFSYATAAMVAIFGENEVAARLFPALFSAATVGVAYCFARRVFGRAPALIAGLVLALSPWEVLFGRTARMYSALSFTFLLALYGTYRVAFERADRWRLPALAAGVCACLFHQLGAMLVVPYAVLLALRQSVSRRLFVAISIVVVTFTTFGVMAFEDHYYAAFERRIVETRGQGGAAEDLEAAPPTGPRALPGLGPGIAVLVAAVSLAAAGVAWRVCRDPWFSLGVLATGFLAGFQHAMLASYAAAAYLVSCLFAGRPPGFRKTFAIGTVLALGSAPWLAVSWGAPGVVRALFAYPPNFLEFFARLHSGMFLVVAGAVLLVLVEFSRDREAFTPRVFLASCLVLPAIGLGFHPGAPELLHERYVFHLDSCFIMLYAFGVWRLTERVTTVASGTAHRRAIAALVATILLLLTGGLAPAATWRAARQPYGNSPQFDGLWNESRFVADHQGSSRYVCERAAPDDLIVPMDVLNHWVYCPRADYQLTLSGKGDAEGWIGIRSGDSLAPVRERLRQGSAQRVWVLLSGYDLRLPLRDARLDTMLDFRNWDCAKKVYEGRDGASDVWVLDRVCMEQRLP